MSTQMHAGGRKIETKKQCLFPIKSATLVQSSRHNIRSQSRRHNKQCVEDSNRLPVSVKPKAISHTTTSPIKIENRMPKTIANLADRLPSFCRS